MKSSYLVPLLCAAAIAFACGPRPHSGEAAATATAATPSVPKSSLTRGAHAPAIASSLDVSVKQGVGFVFHVTNNSSKAIELRFPSGQTHDFVVLDAAEREVWRWSDERMFTQALRNTVLDAGETKSYDGQWSAAAPIRGTFTAVATLRSSNHPIETRVEFTVP